MHYLRRLLNSDKVNTILIRPQTVSSPMLETKEDSSVDECREMVKISERELPATYKTLIRLTGSFVDVTATQPLNYYMNLRSVGHQYRNPRSFAEYFCRRNFAGYYAHLAGLMPTMATGYVTFEWLQSLDVMPKWSAGMIAGAIAGGPLHFVDVGQIFKQTYKPKPGEPLAMSYRAIYERVMAQYGYRGVTWGYAATMGRVLSWHRR